MGVIGGLLGGAAGNYLGGRFLGNAGGGQAAGAALGSLLPFEKGGRVPGAKGKPKVILAHAGEYVLPVGVKPTKAQKAAVAKKHKKR